MTEQLSCAKFHIDHFITTWMRAEPNFHWIWITIENSFMNWAPGYHDLGIGQSPTFPIGFWTIGLSNLRQQLINFMKGMDIPYIASHHPACHATLPKKNSLLIWWLIIFKSPNWLNSHIPQCTLQIPNGANSQIPQCTCPITHNAPFRIWMVHCGIWDMHCVIWEFGLFQC